MKNKRIYWDTAATTPLDKRVFKAMAPYLSQASLSGNSGSIHFEGVTAEKALTMSRQKIADFLATHPDEIIFTGSGTESDNLAILGTALPQQGLKNHIITTPIEHKAVLAPCHYLSKRGFKVTYLPVDKDGAVDLKSVKDSLTPETFLVSVMFANNEIGTVEPIKEIAKIIRAWRRDSKASLPPDKQKNYPYPYFHVDACQAPRFFDLNVEKLGVDLLSLNGSKVYGPKGIGCLYIRRGVKISPIIMGGGQEKGLRAGTVNVAGAVGLAEALTICAKERDKESKKLSAFREELSNILITKIPELIINGDAENYLPNVLNFSVKGLEGEQLVLELDAKGFAVSSGSACSFADENGSYVVQVISGNKERALGSVRLSFGREVQKSEIGLFVKTLQAILAKYGIARTG